MNGLGDLGAARHFLASRIETVLCRLGIALYEVQLCSERTGGADFARFVRGIPNSVAEQRPYPRNGRLRRAEDDRIEERELKLIAFNAGAVASEWERMARWLHLLTPTVSSWGGLVWPRWRHNWNPRELVGDSRVGPPIFCRQFRPTGSGIPAY
jgi:hypothetical protein